MKTRLSLGLLACAVSVASAGFSHPAPAAELQSGITVAWGPEKATGANAAIMAYLGEPVPPPATLNPKYTPEGLIAASKALCDKLGYNLQKLVVDDTEFPFLVYGVVEGSRDLQGMQATLRSMPGYAYGGSVVGRKDGRTYFSLNMISPDQYPAAQRAAIQRRLMIRLQMLGAYLSEGAQ
jgi:hypothetical protein